MAKPLSGLLPKAALSSEIMAPAGAGVGPIDSPPVLDVEPPEKSAASSSGLLSVPSGQQFGALLALNAQRISLKRAASAGRDGVASNTPCKRQFLHQFVTSLGGTTAGDGDDPAATDEGGWDGGHDSALGLRSSSTGLGGTSGAVVSTPILAERAAGQILHETARPIREQISAIHGAEANDGPARRVIMFYYEVLFRPNLTGTLSHGAEREMRTLAVALDFPLDGDLARCGDVLISGFKAFEEATNSGSWEVAENLEAVPPRQLSTISESDRARVTALQIRKVRVQGALQSLRQGTGPASG